MRSMLVRIADNLADMGAAERRVARVVAENPERVPRMSVAALSETAAVAVRQKRERPDQLSALESWLTEKIHSPEGESPAQDD